MVLLWSFLERGVFARGFGAEEVLLEALVERGVATNVYGETRGVGRSFDGDRGVARGFNAERAVA